MRALSLLGIAARVEGIRLKQEAGHKARRLTLAAAALVFAFLTAILVEVAAWLWLERHNGGVQATLLLAAANLFLTVGLLLIARRRRADPVAEEALAQRQRSLAAITKPATLLDALATLPWQRPALRLGGIVLNRLTGRRGGR